MATTPSRPVSNPPDCESSECPTAGFLGRDEALRGYPEKYYFLQQSSIRPFSSARLTSEYVSEVNSKSHAGV